MTTRLRRKWQQRRRQEKKLPLAKSDGGGGEGVVRRRRPTMLCRFTCRLPAKVYWLAATAPGSHSIAGEAAAALCRNNGRAAVGRDGSAIESERAETNTLQRKAAQTTPDASSHSEQDRAASRLLAALGSVLQPDDANRELRAYFIDTVAAQGCRNQPTKHAAIGRCTMAPVCTGLVC